MQMGGAFVLSEVWEENITSNKVSAPKTNHTSLEKNAANFFGEAI